MKEKQYRIQSACVALGVSDGAITGYYSVRGQNLNGRITMRQIIEFINRPKKRNSVNAPDPEEIDEIRNILSTIYVETDDNFEEYQESLFEDDTEIKGVQNEHQ